MKRSFIILFITLVLAAAGYFVYKGIMRWHEAGIESARKQAQEEMASVQRPEVPPERLSEAFGGTPAESAPKDPGKEAEELERQLMAFFLYLDSKEYVAAYEFEGGMYQQFLRALHDLSSNSPLISGETESLHTLFKNMAYFFRVLGVKRINIARDILNNEADIIESAMDLFYRWLTMKITPEEVIKGRPTPKVMYQYAGFFLNTISGKSYLLRRDARVRVLTTYYSVLILDRANDALLNTYGIDIRPHLQSLRQDMLNQTWALHREQYLQELDRMEEKYLR